MSTGHLARGRAEHSTRRRQRVLTAIGQATRTGAEMSVAAIARQAGVDRSFLYRHRDLLDQLHRAQATAPAQPATHALVSRESLQADLANAHERNRRLQARVHQLEQRLSRAMGEQVWHESGLGAAVDIETLQRQITTLEQNIVELNRVIEDHDRDLAAARAANRELMMHINSGAYQSQESPSQRASS